MKIETKFSPGDTLYIKRQKYNRKRKTCIACGGNKKIVLPDGNGYKCPACSGEGWIHVDVDGENYATKELVYAVHISHNGRTPIISYTLSSFGDSAYESACFPTEAECQAECDRLNKDVVK